jgi:Flp pilus assembly pilin Flp
MPEAASNSRRTPAWAGVLRDESGEGFAEYSTMLSLFAVQCVVGALVVSRNVEQIVQAIRAIF